MQQKPDGVSTQHTAQDGRRPTEPLLVELSVPGRLGQRLPPPEVPASPLPPPALLRESLPLPELAEPEVVRHFTRLSQVNYSIDSGFYPLGSCTMKHNPKLNDEMARLPGFAGLHPYQPEQLVEGALALIVALERSLAAITGFAAITLQPAA